jgi:hypothetical protein
LVASNTTRLLPALSAPRHLSVVCPLRRSSQTKKRQRRFGFDKTGEPEPAESAYLLFLAGSDPRAPVRYTGGRTRAEMAGWLVAQTGLFLGKRVRGPGRRRRRGLCWGGREG